MKHSDKSLCVKKNTKYICKKCVGKFAEFFVFFILTVPLFEISKCLPKIHVDFQKIQIRPFTAKWFPWTAFQHKFTIFWAPKAHRISKNG